MSELEPLFPSAPANAITVVTVTQRRGQSEEEEEEEAVAMAAVAAQPDQEQQLQKVGAVKFQTFFLCLRVWICLTMSTSSFSSLQFVSGAKEMCFSLWTAGYWADFIDPTTGSAVRDATKALDNN